MVVRVRIDEKRTCTISLFSHERDSIAMTVMTEDSRSRDLDRGMRGETVGRRHHAYRLAISVEPDDIYQELGH
jgi:hypothetical protein